MLVLDSFRGHLNEDVKKKLQRGQTHMVVIPRGVTSILQLLDDSINKPFKELLRFYGEWMAEGNHRYMPGGKISGHPWKPCARGSCELGIASHPT